MFEKKPKIFFNKIVHLLHIISKLTNYSIGRNHEISETISLFPIVQ
jgi:hypothetical protein